jgi:hypothetical protein
MTYGGLDGVITAPQYHEAQYQQAQSPSVGLSGDLVMSMQSAQSPSRPPMRAMSVCRATGATIPSHMI